MSRNRTHYLPLGAVLIALVALVVAGCGGGGSQATAASKPKTTGGNAATVGVSNNSNLGKVLVDSQGRTVYLFKKDTGSMSTCSGACATDWPPVTSTGKPSAGTGVTASMLGTTARPDGSKQVTYDGHPLYLYVGDQNAGDANGQNVDAFGAKWYVLSPAGSAITGSSGSGGSSSTYGY